MKHSDWFKEVMELGTYISGQSHYISTIVNFIVLYLGNFLVSVTKIGHRLSANKETFVKNIFKQQLQIGAPRKMT